MKVMFVMLALPVALAAQTPLDTTSHPISLTDAVELAQRNAPTAVQARGQLRTANASVKGAYAAFLPNLNLSANRSYRSQSGTNNRIQNGELGGFI